MSYSKPQELFIDLIKYNENNIELLGNMQLHISNIYYITIFDLDNTQITQIISYLVDSENPNPFDNFKSNINLDEEQICKIDLVKSSLQQISKDINTTLEIANESNGKVVLILDIGFLFDLIKIFKESERENHLYDFLLHKLKNKVDKLFILDSNSILTIENNHSSVLDELKIYLCKDKKTMSKIIDNHEVTIYKNHDSLYWKFLDLNKKIEYINLESEESEDLEDSENKLNNTRLVEIEGEESLLTTINLSKICFTNLFEMHSCVLDPLDKLNIVSILE
jgi:hypothetical protein